MPLHQGNKYFENQQMLLALFAKTNKKKTAKSSQQQRNNWGKYDIDGRVNTSQLNKKCVDE